MSDVCSGVRPVGLYHSRFRSMYFSIHSTSFYTACVSSLVSCIMGFRSGASRSYEPHFQPHLSFEPTKVPHETPSCVRRFPLSNQTTTETPAVPCLCGRRPARLRPFCGAACSETFDVANDRKGLTALSTRQWIHVDCRSKSATLRSRFRALHRNVMFTFGGRLHAPSWDSVYYCMLVRARSKHMISMRAPGNGHETEQTRTL